VVGLVRIELTTSALSVRTRKEAHHLLDLRKCVPTSPKGVPILLADSGCFRQLLSLSRPGRGLWLKPRLIVTHLFRTHAESHVKGVPVLQHKNVSTAMHSDGELIKQTILTEDHGPCWFP
jgi:hypothetical protein